MTTHEADRPADYDSVEEEDDMGGGDVLTDEGEDAEPGPVDTDEADEPVRADLVDEADEPVRADVVDEADEPVRADVVDEADEPVRADVVDEADGIDTVPADHTPESDPREKLAPVSPDSAMDPGTGSYQDRWGAIQAGFIDDPRRTVESASALVAEIWDEIARAITDEREGIADRWHTTEGSTDDLRLAMQDYRTLYSRFIRFTSE